MVYSIFSKSDCIFCERAKKLLEKNQLSYHEYIYDRDFNKKDLEKIVPNGKKLTVPQIFKDDIYIGGYTDLISFLRETE
jgi:glutaredoxin